MLPRGILLDIEGTTSSVAFVYDVMFPFARRAIPDYVREHWDTPDFIAIKEQFARDAGATSYAEWSVGHDRPEIVIAEAERLMAGDVKATGLKELQGRVWQAGFERGELVGHVYDDVPPALAAWRAAGIDVRIYSSGSLHAQRLFFAHSAAGDLTTHFSGHYDTTIGGKRDAASYARIADDWRLPAGAILFASDIPAELDAARTAGMRTVLLMRPGNGPLPGPPDHPTATTFAVLVGT